LHDLVPKAIRIAVLLNPANTAIAETTLREVQEAAPSIGLQIQMILNATTIGEIDGPPLRASAPMPSSSLPTHSSSAAPCNLPP
jgi:hypothetical protein